MVNTKNDKHVIAMESNLDSDKVTPVVLAVTPMADIEMSSDIDMAGEMDLAAGVDFNSPLDVNHLLGIDAASVATEHIGTDMDAKEMYGSVSSTTGLLEDSMGMVDMSCSQSSGASSDVQGIVAMKIDNSCDVPPVMSSRSSALSLQDSTSDLFPIDFPSGLSTDDSNTAEMNAGAGNAAISEVLGFIEEHSSDGGMTNNSINMQVTESKECKLVMDEMHRSARHMSATKEWDRRTMSSVDVSDTSSMPDLTISDGTLNEQNSDAQAYSDCGNKVMVSSIENSGSAIMVDTQSADDGVCVVPTVLTVGHVSTESDEIHTVTLRKCKQVATASQRISTRSKQHITDEREAGKPEANNAGDVQSCGQSALMEPARVEHTKDNACGDGLVDTVPRKKESTDDSDFYEDSVTLTSPATSHNVAKRGRPRKQGQSAAARGAKRQCVVIEGADSKMTTELTGLTQLEGNVTAHDLLVDSNEEDTVQTIEQTSAVSADVTGGVKDAMTGVSAEKQDFGDAPTTNRTHAEVSVASSDTVDYGGEMLDIRQQEFMDEPVVDDVGARKKVTETERISRGVLDEPTISSGQTFIGDIPSATAMQPCSVGTADQKNTVNYDMGNIDQCNNVKGSPVNTTDAAASSAITEEASIALKTKAHNNTVDQDAKPTLCPSCGGECTRSVKLNCSHVVCERCASGNEDSATPQTCPACKKRSNTDSAGEKDPAAVAPTANADAEEHSCVDTGEDRRTEAVEGLTVDSVKEPAPSGSTSSSQETSKKPLLATPDPPGTGFSVPPPPPPPGCESSYDGYWSQEQGAQSDYNNTYWSEHQAPPTGWMPPQGGPPPPPPPYGPPPGGPGPMIRGPPPQNVPPPNWYSQSYMQGGPPGWGYPPPHQQWPQPYWYGNNYDYYSYYQWYYNYYGQSQQYSAGVWPPNEWSVAADSLAAAAAATTSSSTSTTTAVTSSKAAATSKLVVSTVSNRPMSSIPLPTSSESVAVTSWPPAETVTSWPPQKQTSKAPAVMTVAPRPVAPPAKPQVPRQPVVKPFAPVAVPQPVAQPVRPTEPPQLVTRLADSPDALLPASTTGTFVTQAAQLPKTAGDSRIEKQKKQLYIFNLPQDTLLAEVKSLVTKYGKVIDCAMADDQGHAGLLAVVTMETVAGTTICCTGLRNYQFKGRQLEVRRAHTKKSEEVPQVNITPEVESSSGVTSSSEARLPDTGVTSNDEMTADTQRHVSMWVGNLPPGTKAKDVLDLLNSHGKVINCKIGSSKGKDDLFAMVVMETSSDSAQCINKLHGSEFHGQKLQLKKLKQKSSGTKKAE